MCDSEKEISLEIHEIVGQLSQPVRSDWYKDCDLTNPNEVKRLIREIVNG